MKVNQHLADKVRDHFPSLERKFNGIPIAYFDGPGGSQVPNQVIEAISYYYQTSNANVHGAFITSSETDGIIDKARGAAAALLNAPSGRQISFGANMTTLTFSLSRAMGRYLNPGDEILITQLDHEGNRGPWLSLREIGIQIREVRMKKNGLLDYDDFEKKLNERTRVVAVGHASNLLGTLNDIAWIRDRSKEYGAWLVVDGVHFAPHFPVDVQEIGADFYLCSAYKFYGPHIGVLYCRENLLEQLNPDRLTTQCPSAPTRIETGTLNHACLNGVIAAIEFIASFGEGSSFRDLLESAMRLFASNEHRLGSRLWDGLTSIPGTGVFGPDFKSPDRAPTISFSVEGKHPKQVGRFLGERALMLMDGHFYAARAVDLLGLSGLGGVVRAGVSIYNTEEEVDRLLDGVDALSS